MALFFGDEIILKFHLNGRGQIRQVACETWRCFIYQVRRKNIQVLWGKLYCYWFLFLCLLASE